MKFRQYHLSTVLKSFELQKGPLDAFLSRYFRQHKSIGSKDRLYIGDTAYHYIRWKNLFQYIDKHADEIDPQSYLQDVSIPIPIRYGMPPLLYTLLVDAYGEPRAQEISLISNTRAPLTVRINPLKTSREEMLQKWPKATPCPLSPFGIHVHERINFFTLPEFKEGFFEIQDEASQIAASLVLAKPKQKVLDYCAGAGGKTLAFAHKLQQSGQIYLHDIRQNALQEARKRLNRAGVQNVQFSISPALKGKMDWVIVDVPCSGTGTLRRNPDLKWKFETIDLQKLIEEQRDIFQEALAYLNPEGHIVYMTCSILPQENEQQIRHFQKTFDLEVVETFQTLPLLNGMDGFFTTVLKARQKNQPMC